MHPHQLELLAPARDADIGIAAIDHGADAVYIGGPSFGARAAAGNRVQDIARLVQHAQRFYSRVFVTLNTILRDDELEPARKLAWQLYDAGVAALIIQDFGLLEIDLPPIQLHASTQCDIRSPEKARFLQSVGLSQLVLARELTLTQIADIRAATDPERCTLEFFIHGALCVAYSGQCNISEAQTGRSANRGDCSQACRLPYQVLDAQGRFIAHDKHVLSLKDNNQSANLAALVEVGVRSFKIEGRYKDLAYVKNITAHYRLLLDALLEQRPQLARGSSGRTTFAFTPDPQQNFNRAFTDYFVQGRKDDIGAFDSPKNPGQPLGWVSRIGPDWIELETTDPAAVLHNGDGLCYFDLQQTLVGLAINRAEVASGSGRWRVYPKDPISQFKDLRRDQQLNRNRDMDWVRRLNQPSSQRRIGVWLTLTETTDGLALHLSDEDGCSASASLCLHHQPAQDPVASQASLRQQLGKLGGSVFEPLQIALQLSQPWFVPAARLNALRRAAVAALEAARRQAWQRPPRAEPLQPPALYPEDSLTYLANVFNHKARDFYARCGVRLIAAAFESHQETGAVSLMISKHCVRYSLSLCPKQAKGVPGVQGTLRAEPLRLVHGKDTLTLRFDCKACEMHVVGSIRPAVLQRQQTQADGAPLRFYRNRPAA